MERSAIGPEPEVQEYITAVHRPEHPVMAALREKTAPMPMAMMQVSPEQAEFLKFLIGLIGAKSILEIGTFTGYSALAMALALPPDGKLVACDVSEEWTSLGKKHWLEAGVADKIDLRIAPALETLAALETGGQANSFDMAFIDAQKTEYDGYYEACLKLVRPGGLIVLDNMLQGGSVADAADTGSSTAAIRELNAKIAVDDRVEAVLLPMRDGVTVARRLG